MNWNDKRIVAAGCVVLGLAFGNLFSNKVTLMAPAGDTKILSSYIRNGFANRLMSKDRRVHYSKCYDNFIKQAELKAPSTTPQSDGGTTLSTQPTKTLEGLLTYVFHLTEDGKIIDFELAENELNDSSFAKCVEKAFEKLRFLPPPLGINRYLAYEMSFKKDETYLKELEEKKSNPPITLVPTPPKETPESNSDKTE